jgi:outer membrane receptor protein involved in Fe transport
MRSVFYCTGLLLLTCLNGAWANLSDSTRQDSIRFLDVVVVTASRASFRSFDIPDHVSKIDRSNLELLSPMSTPELASYIPGVWMQKTNHGGGSPYIRGLTGYHTLLVLDGIRFNNAIFRSGPNQYLNTIDPWTIEEIEVLHGQGSVQYGSDGIGGTVQLFSRALSFNQGRGWRVKGNVAGKLLSNNMEKTSRAEVTASSKRIAFLAGFTHKDFGDIHAGGNLGVLLNTGYNEHSWDVKSKVILNKKQTLTVLYQQVAQHEIPVYHQLITGKFSRYHTTLQQRQMAYAKLESQYNKRFINEVRYTLSYQQGDEIREKQASSSEILRTETDKVTTMGMVTEVISSPLSNWSISSGIEVYQDVVNSAATDKDFQTQGEISVRGLYPDGASQHNFGIFSLHNIELNKFTITGGLRFNVFSLALNDPTFGSTRIQPEALVGSTGLVYKASKNIHFVTTAGTGFRTPNVNDVASLGITDFRYEVPNYNLSPEKSFQYQAGVKLNNKKGFISLFAYRNHITDMITNLPSTFQSQDSINGFRIYQRFNADKAMIKGIEFEAHQKLNQSFNVTGSFTHTLGDNITKQEPLSRIPPLFGRMAISYQSTNLTTMVEFTSAGKQDRLSAGDKKDSRIATGGTPSWTTLNLRAQYKFKWMMIQLSANNMFDKAYRIHGSGVDGIGRSYSLMATFHF